MNAEQMKEKFDGLYMTMATNENVNYMRIFGNVHREMMEWMIVNKPELAQEWLDELEAINWNNYLTRKEAEKIVAGMVPKAPWTLDQWKQAMEQHGFETEKPTCYNQCVLYTTMNMIMSDSSETLSKYVENGKLFKIVHDLAVDKLTDKDGVFNIRSYFGV